MHCQTYQPLPISTRGVGIDRCGNGHAYAAPSVVQARVNWCNWPIPAQLPWYPWCGGRPVTPAQLAQLRQSMANQQRLR